ncbi:hypothetical protein D0863_11891 [Hortaea werneckii]|uniref:Uncharacterized protein n=1 Tax=Hortaea werneckii TaxID=91943 RepID=A0A3M7D5K4_HORWE|nr:hypothetical protein D0863_11891 [Hortaea werneckii]
MLDSVSDKQSSSSDAIAAEDTFIESSPPPKHRIPYTPTTTQRKAEKQLERLLYDPVSRPDFEGCRHDFQEDGLLFQIPKKYDYVFFAAVPILEEYNAQLMHRHYDLLLTEALNIAPTLFYGMDSTSAVHCLVRHELSIKVQLKLVCHLDHGWSAATVMLKDEDRWIPLQKWLKTLPEPTLPNYHMLAYEEQYQWWRSTGKPFRLLDLPGELQERIFLFAVGKHIEPHFRAEYIGDEEGHAIMQEGTRAEDGLVLKQRRWTVITHGTPKSKEMWPRRPERQLYMRCGSKAPRSSVHRKEFLAVGYVLLTRHSRISGIPTYTSSRFRPYPNRIHLALDNVALLLLFGVPLPGINDAFTVRPSPPPAHILPTLLPHLKYLDIYFQFTARRSHNPWHTTEKTSDRDRLTNLTKESGTDLQRMPCQRILHCWILTYAYEYIREIPRVE